MQTKRIEGVSRMLNKVPEVTIYFWIIKIMATTVGERVHAGPLRLVPPG